MREHAFGYSCLPCCTASFKRVRRALGKRESQVSQIRLCCAPAVLEGDQTNLVCVRAAKIKNFQSKRFCPLDRFPVETVHAPEPVKSSVGAAVFVDQGILVAQRKHTGDGLLTDESNANLQCRTKALDQITEPDLGLRRHSMATTRDRKQSIKGVEDCFRCARLMRKAFTLCPFNFPLDRIFVKSPKKCSDVWFQIESMKNVFRAGVSQWGYRAE